MAWRTAELAVLDLQKIAEHGIVNFGVRHARDYTAGFLDVFDALAAHPALGVERQASTRLVRLMPSGSRNILYVIENEDVVILRVLHGLQNWFELL